MRHGRTPQPYVQTWTQWCQVCYTENTVTKGVTHRCGGCGMVLYRSPADAKKAQLGNIIRQAARKVGTQA